MTLRGKLLLLSLSVLALPWAGWKFVQQLEFLLRQGQEQALLASAEALARGIAVRPAGLPASGPGWFVHRLDYAPRLDGEAGDWQGASEAPVALGGARPWLRAALACQVVNGIPGASQREGQQTAKRDARGQIGRQEGQQADESRAQPVGQRSGFVHQFAQHLWLPPAAVAGGHFQHHAKGGNVGQLPGFPPQKTGQHISHAKQDERQPGQAAHRRLRHDGGGGLVHGG